MSNVIKFPIHKVDEKKTAEKKEALLRERKSQYAEKLTERYGERILHSLHRQGFDVDSVEFLEDYIFVMESFKSCILRNLGIEHPLQKIKSKLHEFVDDPDS